MGRGRSFDADKLARQEILHRLVLVSGAQAERGRTPHALAADGSLVAQHDAPPSQPMSQWKIGQIILDVHEFALPADRPLTLTAGMYLPDTGERLAVSTTAPEPNAVLITSLAPQ